MVERLKRSGKHVVLLSGDRRKAVAATAAALGIADWQAGLAPGEKVSILAAFAARGRKTLMIGDGLNDAPALAAAFCSMSPASAADVSQTAADIVFQGLSLGAVTEALGRGAPQPAAGAREPRLRRALQRARRAAGDARAGDAADRRARHVELVADRRRQRAAARAERAMSGLLLLIPVALALGLLGLATFLWALHSGQFDDLDGAAGRILFDDEADRPSPPPPPPPPTSPRRSP